MDSKIDIQICLGSSCFSRGNKRLVRVIDQYLGEHNLRHLVHFHGAHCYGKCDIGPSLKIDGKHYTLLTEEDLMIVLNDLFGKRNTGL